MTNGFNLRQSGLWTACSSAMLVSAAALCILISPPPPPYQAKVICAEVQSIGKQAHILENCDASEFLDLAHDPSGVLARGSQRQTRPGYGVLGWIFALPFRALGAATVDPYYAGYVALNWLLMVLAAILLADLIGATSLIAPAAVVPTAILLVNHITKVFFWTPHLQVFGLFSSMLAIWVAQRLLVWRHQLSLAVIALAGFGSGIACLIYGAFVLVPATITVVLWFFRRNERPGRKFLLTCTLWVSTLAPLTAWAAYVMRRTGSFYSHETEYYHEFVWMVEKVGVGSSAFATALLRNLETFAQTVPEALFVPLAFIAATFVLAISRQRSMPTGVFSSASVKAASAFLVVAVPFYALMGFYTPRLTAVLGIPLLVILGSATRSAFSTTIPGRTGMLPEPATIAALGYVAIVIFVPGPYA